MATPAARSSTRRRFAPIVQDAIRATCKPGGAVVARQPILDPADGSGARRVALPPDAPPRRARVPQAKTAEVLAAAFSPSQHLRALLVWTSRRLDAAPPTVAPEDLRARGQGGHGRPQSQDKSGYEPAGGLTPPDRRKRARPGGRPSHSLVHDAGASARAPLIPLRGHAGGLGGRGRGRVGLALTGGLGQPSGDV